MSQLSGQANHKKYFHSSIQSIDQHIPSNLVCRVVNDSHIVISLPKILLEVQANPCIILVAVIEAFEQLNCKFIFHQRVLSCSIV